MACLEKRIAENRWLNYYNQILFERGVINEKQRNKMALLIVSRTRQKSSNNAEEF